MLFRSSEEILILGFSIGNDIPHLERFCCSCCEGKTPLRHQSILDLQQMQCSLEGGSSSSLPGLKACVSRFSTASLSKTEQCSDWSQRPLSAEQLSYAGIDAAVLLALLAEYLRKVKGQSEKLILC